jgi:hypothetical protein
MLLSAAPLMVAALLLIAHLSNAAPEDLPIPLELRPCLVFDINNREEIGATCAAVAFSPDDSATKSVFSELCAGFSWCKMGRDVMSFPDAGAIAQAMYERPGSIEHAVVFTSDRAVQAGHVRYEIWKNVTAFSAYVSRGKDLLGSKLGLKGRSLALQLAVDAAVTGFKLKRAAGSDGKAPAADFETKFQPFHQSPDSSAEASSGSSASGDGKPPFSDVIVNLVGGACIIFATVIMSLISMGMLSEEKSSNLLLALQTMGLFESAHWASWIVPLSLSAVLPGIAAVLVGVVGGLSAFTRCDFFFHFLSIWVRLGLSFSLFALN